MRGTKAEDLKLYCREQGLSFVRFDYSGHGESGGDFAEASISKWLADLLAIIDRVADGKVLLVGSSMGGWLALLACLRRPERVGGLLLIACAADMTKFYPKRLAGLSPQTDGEGRVYYSVANEYDDQQPYSIYQHLLDDGASHFVLDSPIDIEVPVSLIHGLRDEVVEPTRSEQVMNCLASDQVRLLTVKSGDHRLSKQADLNLIRLLLSDLLASMRQHSDRLLF